MNPFFSSAWALALKKLKDENVLHNSIIVLASDDPPSQLISSYSWEHFSFDNITEINELNCCAFVNGLRDALTNKFRGGHIWMHAFGYIHLNTVSEPLCSRKICHLIHLFAFSLIKQQFLNLRNVYARRSMQFSWPLADCLRFWSSNRTDD